MVRSAATRSSFFRRSEPSTRTVPDPEPSHGNGVGLYIATVRLIPKSARSPFTV